jgi:hypothetical protein
MILDSDDITDFEYDDDYTEPEPDNNDYSYYEGFI